VPRRYLWFVLVAVAAIVTFVQLGLWQLDRLRERRTANAAMVGRRTQPEQPLSELARDTATARFRAVRVAGRYDYDNQFIWTARTRDGAPGVVFLTPIIVDGGPAVLVNRGWAYSADGSTINDSLWREAERDTVIGYAEVYTSGTGPVFVGSQPRRIRRLALDSLRPRLPYEIAPLLVVQQRGAGNQVEVQHPFRVALPPLDEGPHRGYALQWFAFALITIVGTVAAVQRGRRERGDRPR
jgi:surfeit locus 1 family protein